MEHDKTTQWSIMNTNANSMNETELSDAREILQYVYIALKEKGYNPVVQLTGFITTGDPTYITSHKQARSMICRVDRDDLVEELVRSYLNKLNKEIYE